MKIISKRGQRPVPANKPGPGWPFPYNADPTPPPDDVLEEELVFEDEEVIRTTTKGVVDVDINYIEVGEDSYISIDDDDDDVIGHDGD